MKTIMAFAAAILIAGCATPQQQSDSQIRAAAEALEQNAQDIENQMSPDDRQAFHQHVEQNAVREMQAKAHACGTSLVFSDEAKFDDRTVYVDASASQEQLACVQRSYPFVKSSPK